MPIKRHIKERNDCLLLLQKSVELLERTCIRIEDKQGDGDYFVRDNINLHELREKTDEMVKHIQSDEYQQWFNNLS